MSHEEALRIYLEGLPDEAYEPVVVQYVPDDYRLLDFHMLLMAEPRLFSDANCEALR